jgi:hypothetical protein
MWLKASVFAPEFRQSIIFIDASWQILPWSTSRGVSEQRAYTFYELRGDAVSAAVRGDAVSAAVRGDTVSAAVRGDAVSAAGPDRNCTQ